jgi:choline dehydrogenase-like flavoprotein
MSKSKVFPQGLANSSGLVGRYLMFDAGALCAGLFEHPLNEYKSVQVTRVLHDFYDSDPKRGFYGGGGIDARFLYYPSIFALWGGLPPDTPRWGAGFKSSMARYFNYSMSLLSHSICLALERNAIDLDPELKDAWGLPAVRVTFEQHPDDLKTLRFLLDRQMEILDAADATRKWAFPIGETTFSAHLMGTCRMGNDPRTSVVDRFNRAHDVPNLFIVDGSSLVTCGRQQPTATIQALAYWAAEHMVRRANAGEI